MQPIANNPYAFNPHAAQHAPGAFNASQSPGLTAQYEFSNPENEDIKATANWTKQAGQMNIFFMGILPAIVGLTVGLGGNAAGWGQLVGAIPAFYVGTTLMGASKQLSSVVTSQGNDIPLLMTALRGYTRAFKIQVVMVCIAFVLGLGANIAGSLMRSH